MQLAEKTKQNRNKNKTKQKKAHKNLLTPESGISGRLVRNYINNHIHLLALCYWLKAPHPHSGAEIRMRRGNGVRRWGLWEGLRS